MATIGNNFLEVLKKLGKLPRYNLNILLNNDVKREESIELRKGNRRSY